MTSTRNEHISTSQGACVFCNTVRPIEQVLCPACGRGWIDASAAESVDSVVRAEAEAIRTITTDPALPIRRSTYRKAWWVPVVGAALVFGVYWLAVAVLGDDGSADTGPIATPTTLAPSTTVAVELPPTTLPPPTTTTPPAPSTTTATTPPTTTTTTTTLPPLPIGDAIPLEDLQLGAVELGAIAFGTAADEALPDLVATFGQPSAIDDATESWGLCSGDTGRVITFGGLHIITVTADGSETLAGYILDTAGTASDSLVTFSGVGLGSTLDEMSDTYRSFTTDVSDATASWVVSSFNDGRTLLWGTSTDADSPVVDRIASPRSCDGGPATG